jgi:hypothetical protein
LNELRVSGAAVIPKKKLPAGDVDLVAMKQGSRLGAECHAVDLYYSINPPHDGRAIRTDIQ